MFSFHKNSLAGGNPGPLHDIRAARAAPPAMVRPRNPEAGHRSRAIPVRGTTAPSRSSKPMSGHKGARTTQPRAASMISAT